MPRISPPNVQLGNSCCGPTSSILRSKHRFQAVSALPASHIRFGKGVSLPLQPCARRDLGSNRAAGKRRRQPSRDYVDNRSTPFHGPANSSGSADLELGFAAFFLVVGDLGHDGRRRLLAIRSLWPLKLSGQSRPALVLLKEPGTKGCKGLTATRHDGAGCYLQTTKSWLEDRHRIF